MVIESRTNERAKDKRVVSFPVKEPEKQPAEVRTVASKAFAKARISFADYMICTNIRFEIQKFNGTINNEITICVLKLNLRYVSIYCGSKITIYIRHYCVQNVPGSFFSVTGGILMTVNETLLYYSQRSARGGNKFGEIRIRTDRRYS